MPTGSFHLQDNPISPNIQIGKLRPGHLINFLSHVFVCLGCGKPNQSWQFTGQTPLISANNWPFPPSYSLPPSFLPSSLPFLPSPFLPLPSFPPSFSPCPYLTLSLPLFLAYFWVIPTAVRGLSIWDRAHTHSRNNAPFPHRRKPMAGFFFPPIGVNSHICMHIRYILTSLALASPVNEVSPLSEVLPHPEKHT